MYTGGAAAETVSLSGSRKKSLNPVKKDIMWLDGVIVLPLIALGIYGLIWEKKKALYFWTLFYGIISNWYMGYMLCLFHPHSASFNAIKSVRNCAISSCSTK